VGYDNVFGTASSMTPFKSHDRIKINKNASVLEKWQKRQKTKIYH